MPLFPAGTIWCVLAMQRRCVRHVLRVNPRLDTGLAVVGFLCHSLLASERTGVFCDIAIGGGSGIDWLHGFLSFDAASSKLN
jgi:hypothetical protein